MKKAVAVLMAVVMVLALSATAFAAGGRLTLEQAKQVALEYAGVRVSEATFTRAHRDWENGREVYEIEFYANGTEYDMNVDVNSGTISAFSTEFYGQPAYSSQPAPGNGGYPYWDDDWYDHDWDDRYDRDWDDIFDWFD